MKHYIDIENFAAGRRDYYCSKIAKLPGISSAENAEKK